MVALLSAASVVAGALDLLIVIIAISVLGRSQAWAGYLDFVFGAGAVLAATVSAVLIGRRLGGPILAAALMFSAAVAGLAAGPGLAPAERGPTRNMPPSSTKATEPPPAPIVLTSTIGINAW